MRKLLLVAALIAAPALAVRPSNSVPAATARVSTYYSPFQGSTKSITIHSAGALTNGSVVGEAELTNVPFVSVSMSQGTNDYIDSGSATLTYSFLLTGTGTDPVPLHAYVKAFTKTTGTGDYEVASNVNISNDTSSASVGLRGTQSFDDVLNFTAKAGDITTVTLTVSASLSCCDDPAGSYAAAYADPFFYIDADYLAAHPGMNFGLQFSDGVGNADPNLAAVPETASWAMMVMGFGAVGAAFRRRKAVVSFA